MSPVAFAIQSVGPGIRSAMQDAKVINEQHPGRVSLAKNGKHLLDCRHASLSLADFHCIAIKVFRQMLTAFVYLDIVHLELVPQGSVADA